MISVSAGLVSPFPEVKVGVRLRRATATACLTEMCQYSFVAFCSVAIRQKLFSRHPLGDTGCETPSRL